VMSCYQDQVVVAPIEEHHRNGKPVAASPSPQLCSELLINQ